MQLHLYDLDRPETFPFAERLRALADERPGRFLLAELASDDPEGAIADYTAPGRFHTAYAVRFLSKPFGPAVIR
ncbi:alpha-glucosidase, partial [Acinetobacter baumannii]